MIRTHFFPFRAISWEFHFENSKCHGSNIPVVYVKRFHWKSYNEGYNSITTLELHASAMQNGTIPVHINKWIHKRLCKNAISLHHTGATKNQRNEWWKIGTHKHNIWLLTINVILSIHCLLRISFFVTSKITPMKSFHIIRTEKQPRRRRYIRNKKKGKWKFSCRNSTKDEKISNLNVRNLLKFLLVCCYSFGS